MTATADGGQKIMCSGKRHCPRNIFRARALRDERRMAIKHRIPQLARRVVSLVLSQQQLAAETSTQILYVGGGKRDLLSSECDRGGG